MVPNIEKDYILLLGYSILYKECLPRSNIELDKESFSSAELCLEEFHMGFLLGSIPSLPKSSCRRRNACGSSSILTAKPLEVLGVLRTFHVSRF